MSVESPAITDPRIARAKAMRQAGAETAEIARACGVGVSTAHPCRLTAPSTRTRSEPGSAGTALL